MKQSFAFIFLLISFACSSGLYAQQVSIVKISVQDSLKKDSVNKLLVTRPKSIYLEAGGPAGYYSLNYDMRFRKKQNGLGARIGVTYVFVDNEDYIAVPFAFNYLFGKKKHFFELGAGATYYYDYHTDYSPILEDILSGESQTDGYSPKLSRFGSGLIATFTAGYRYQPVKGGFSFRAGNSVIFRKDFLPFWPYVSIGYSFKNKTKATKVKSS